VIFFDWDPHKERANRRKHRVRFSEACTVFEDALARIFCDGEHSEHEIRELIIGHSSAGRLLLVSFIERPPEQVRIIGAREATRTEQRDYEEAV
jgi:hypothetical protein